MRDGITRVIGKYPISTPGTTGSEGLPRVGVPGTQDAPQKMGFFKQLTQLFGFKKSSSSKSKIDFVKVDAESDLRISQGKVGRLFRTKMSGKLEELFDFWSRDTLDSQQSLMDRQKRLSELNFAVMNDPFLSMAADLYADEATQIDVQGKLIQIDCADVRMKDRMEDLLTQWGITQNRLRSACSSLATYGDAFWSNKITKNGVIRIAPLSIHQVKERLEFNPVQVQEQLALQRGYMTTINRDQKLKILLDTLENEENEEITDIFDTKLFGFALDDDMVVPPWAITHFRLNIEQSEYFPMGKSLFLKALAPFRQCNATMVLQSLARVMSFPVTVYNVQTAPGMDEALQFDKINQVREEYENIGDASAGNENFSVNTKIWAPKGLLELEMHSPQIDINATGDIQMYQDRVAIASGVPKGYLVQEWGGFGNSAISLVEQFKPFARRVFTVQSAVLDGIANLFRLHFAITGEFDYREPFVLSMKFPNEESSDQKLGAKQNSLNLSKDVLETISTIVGALNDPLPPEVIQDILQKFSFLDPADIKKWIKHNPNKKKDQEDQPEEFESGDDFGGGSISGGGDSFAGGGGVDSEGLGDEGGGEILGNTGGIDADIGEGDMTGGEEDTSPEESKPKEEKAKIYGSKLMERERRIRRRIQEAEEILSEKVLRGFSKIDESQMNNRHFKYAHVEHCNEPMYRLFQKDRGLPLRETSTTIQKILEEEKPHIQEWSFLDKEAQDEINLFNNRLSEDVDYEGKSDDQERVERLKQILK